MKNLDLTAAPWRDYELLDSGDNKKLERFGAVVLIRPETQAIWRPAHPELWKQAKMEFRFDGGKGSWRGKGAPEKWDISWNDDARCTLRLTSFKHIGIFPEQAPNWEWIAERVDALGRREEGEEGRKDKGRPDVLNLFGYTGIASIVAAKHGARVTQCDASKQSNAWAKENAALSDVPPDSIRYITDDALKFVEREARRGSVYDGIILDPPAFGRGPDGEVWKIEDDICKLLDTVKKLLAQKPGSFFLLNGYAAGYAPQSLLQSVESSFPEIAGAKKIAGEFGELQIGEKASGRAVPSGIYVRFVL
ncbi:MAG: class I SAM-dependent methyltransferase [Candidatus Pacebacteria bacterium]|nr:class I SAM-dependent methyltransferase [Candidatus Paceibacterota bacterium]